MQKAAGYFSHELRDLKRSWARTIVLLMSMSCIRLRPSTKICAKRSDATPLIPAVVVAVSTGAAMAAAEYHFPIAGRAAAEEATKVAAMLAFIALSATRLGYRLGTRGTANAALPTSSGGGVSSSWRENRATFSLGSATMRRGDEERRGLLVWLRCVWTAEGARASLAPRQQRTSMWHRREGRRKDPIAVGRMVES